MHIPRIHAILPFPLPLPPFPRSPKHRNYPVGFNVSHPPIPAPPSPSSESSRSTAPSSLPGTCGAGFLAIVFPATATPAGFGGFGGAPGFPLILPGAPERLAGAVPPVELRIGSGGFEPAASSSRFVLTGGTAPAACDGGAEARYSGFLATGGAEGFPSATIGAEAF